MLVQSIGRKGDGYLPQSVGPGPAAASSASILLSLRGWSLRERAFWLTQGCAVFAQPINQCDEIMDRIWETLSCDRPQDFVDRKWPQ